MFFIACSYSSSSDICVYSLFWFSICCAFCLFIGFSVFSVFDVLSMIDPLSMVDAFSMFSIFSWSCVLCAFIAIFMSGLYFSFSQSCRSRQ